MAGSISSGSTLGATIGTNEIEASAVTEAKINADVVRGSNGVVITPGIDNCTVVAGTWKQGNHTDYAYCAYFDNSTADALNDEITMPLNLQAGTYDISMRAYEANGAAQVTLYDGATSLGTIDLYNATADKDAQQTLSGVTIASSGEHTIHVKVTGKNASSSGYNVYLSALCFKRTGA